MSVRKPLSPEDEALRAHVSRLRTEVDSLSKTVERLKEFLEPQAREFCQCCRRCGAQVPCFSIPCDGICRCGSSDPEDEDEEY